MGCALAWPFVPFLALFRIVVLREGLQCKADAVVVQLLQVLRATLAMLRLDVGSGVLHGVLAWAILGHEVMKNHARILSWLSFRAS
jgi:hypothetical protein